MAKDKYVNNLLLSFKLSSSSGFSAFNKVLFFLSLSLSSFFIISEGFFNLPGRILFLISPNFCPILSKGFFNFPGIIRGSSFSGGDKNLNLSSFNFPGTKSFLV